MAAVTVVGAGRIGLPVVARLTTAGHEVDVVDIDDRRRDDVIDVGATWSGAVLTDVADERILITVLPGNAELSAVMTDGSGRLRHMRGGVTWVDMTSTAPDVSADLGAQARELGVRRLDAAVGGGPADAQRGALTLYVGGTVEDLGYARPVLDTFAARIVHVGEAGTGHLVKLLINQLWFGQAAAVAEVMLVGAQAGVPPSAMAAVLAGSPADSSFVRAYLPRVLAGDYVHDFELSRVVEELDSLQRVADSTESPWSVSTAVAELHRAALTGLGDSEAELAVVAYLEGLAGRQLR